MQKIEGHPRFSKNIANLKNLHTVLCWLQKAVKLSPISFFCILIIYEQNAGCLNTLYTYINTYSD